MAMNSNDTNRLVAVYDVFDILSAPNPPLYVMPASQAYRTWQPNVPFPAFVAAHLAAGPPPPPHLRRNDANSTDLCENKYRKTSSKSVSLKSDHLTRSADQKKSGMKGSSVRFSKNNSVENDEEDRGAESASKKPAVCDKEGSPSKNQYAAKRQNSSNSDKSSGLSIQSCGNSTNDSGLGSLSSKTEKSHKTDSDTISIERYPANPSGGGSIVITKTKSHVICRLEYAREFMLQCSLSPWTKLSPAQMPHIVHNFPELLPSGPKSFCPFDYKMKYAKMHNGQQMK